MSHSPVTAITPLRADRLDPDVLDGAMIVLAMYTLNVFHPGFLLGRANVWSSANKTPSEADSDIPEMKARSRTGARDV